MTANAMAGDREKCLQAGMNDHLAKPIDPDRLFETLLRWVPSRAVATTAQATGSSAPTGAGNAFVIPGIDTVTALKRSGGNPRRYGSLLTRFADSQSGALSEIRAALTAHDPATARRIVHSLKGASANLGATCLAATAAKVEEAIEANETVQPALEHLSQSLEATILAIHKALPDESPAPSSTAGDTSTIVQHLSRLKKLLEADDGEAPDFLLQVRSKLLTVLTISEIETLSFHIGNFGYSDALRALSGIAERLSLVLE
jgi:HPt (histidine-containing phosphotransfer) domain-containing protein